MHESGGVVLTRLDYDGWRVGGWGLAVECLTMPTLGRHRYRVEWEDRVVEWRRPSCEC